MRFRTFTSTRRGKAPAGTVCVPAGSQEYLGPLLSWATSGSTGTGHNGNTRFVDQGGYGSRQTGRSLSGGRPSPRLGGDGRLPRLDRRPGPATWEGGAMRRTSRSSGRGVSWFEAAAYARFAEGRSVYWMRAVGELLRRHPAPEQLRRRPCPWGAIWALSFGAYDLPARQGGSRTPGEKRYILAAAGTSRATFETPTPRRPGPRAQLRVPRAAAPPPPVQLAVLTW